MAIKYPDTETVEAFIKIHLERTGTKPSFLSKSNLMFVLDSVKDISNNSASVNGLIYKAAYLISKTIELHPMTDGNKRVAILLAELFLRMNGKRITATSDEIYEKMIALAKHDIKENDIRNWLVYSVT